MIQNLQVLYSNWDIITNVIGPTGTLATLDGPERCEGILVVRSDTLPPYVGINGVQLPQVSDASTLDPVSGKVGWYYDAVNKLAFIRFLFGR